MQSCKFRQCYIQRKFRIFLFSAALFIRQLLQLQETFGQQDSIPAQVCLDTNTQNQSKPHNNHFIIQTNQNIEEKSCKGWKILGKRFGSSYILSRNLLFFRWFLKLQISGFHVKQREPSSKQASNSILAIKTQEFDIQTWIRTQNSQKQTGKFFSSSLGYTGKIPAALVNHLSGFSSAKSLSYVLKGNMHSY